MSALDLLAALVLDDQGRRWGEIATDFQWSDAKAILKGPQRNFFLTRPRGASKTTDLGAIAVVALLEQLPPASRSYAVAADKDQGRLLLNAIEGFVSRTPELRGALRVNQWRISSRSNATLEVLAADAPSAWGLLPHLVVVDELAQWTSTSGPRKVWEAIISSVPKVPNSRIAVLTTAGEPNHWSHKVIETARASDAWMVSEVPGPTPWSDPAEIEKQRDLLMESSFRHLHLNEWTTSEDKLTTLSDIEQCITLDGPQDHTEHRRRYIVGVDLGLVKDRTVASICHLEGDTVVLDRQQVWQGSRANPVQLNVVEEWLVEARRQYGRIQVVIDPWQAAGLAQRLRDRHVDVKEYTMNPTSIGRLAVSLHQLLREHRLALYPDPDLEDELANVRLEERAPGHYRIDHDPDKHDDRVISLALACHTLMDSKQRKPIDSEAMARALGELAQPSPWGM